MFSETNSCSNEHYDLFITAMHNIVVDTSITKCHHVDNLVVECCSANSHHFVCLCKSHLFNQFCDIC